MTPTVGARTVRSYVRLEGICIAHFVPELPLVEYIFEALSRRFRSYYS